MYRKRKFLLRSSGHDRHFVMLTVGYVYYVSFVLLKFSCLMAVCQALYINITVATSVKLPILTGVFVFFVFFYNSTIYC